MFEIINFSEIFVSLLKGYYDKYKNNNGFIKKYLLQTRYLSLLTFLYNSCYWSRFNKDPDTGKWLANCISGKYLNEIHLFLVKYNFYRSLYTHILRIYLRITNYETLSSISVDSCFIRNIQGAYLSRNPNYYNKPGIKVHALVDSFRVPISFIVTDCNVSDSVIIKKLIENAFIGTDIINEHCKVFLADSAYSGFVTIEYITSLGLDVIIGRNKQHTKKVFNIKKANMEDLKKYKSRGIVENFFSNFLRVPCLINNYERTIKSYEGIALFHMASSLAKKINKIIKKKNNAILRENYEKGLIQKREIIAKRKLKRYNIRKKKRKIAEREKQERNESTNIIIMKIKNRIANNINKACIRRNYNKYIKIYNNNKVRTRGKKKDTSYDKCHKYIIDNMYKYMIDTVLTQTYSYKFGEKELYLLKAHSYCFTDNNIDEQMESINVNNKINQYIYSFFNS